MIKFCCGHWVANFAEIMKIATLLMQTTFNNLEKKIRKKCIKMQFLSVFPDITKLINSAKKMLKLSEIKECVKWFI